MQEKRIRPTVNRGPWILIVVGIAAIIGGCHDPAHPPGPPPEESEILLRIQFLGMIWLGWGISWLWTRRMLSK